MSHLPFYISPDDAPAKREILKAALQLFVRDGLCETSVRDIAAATGYSNPALFRHFESKDALARHLFERCYRRLSEDVFLSAFAAAGFAARLHHVVARYTALLDESPEALLYVQDHLRHFWPRLSPHRQRHSMIGSMRRLLEDGKDEGAVMAALPVDLLVAAMGGLLAQFARQFYFGEFTGSAADWAPGLEQLLTRLARG